MSEAYLSPTVIQDQPIPLLDGTWTDPTGDASDSALGDMPTPNTIPDISTPKGFVASEVISESLDTQARAIKGPYTFDQVGSLQIGSSSDGVKISPQGIVATKGGSDTVTISSTGDATFKGTVAAGSVVTGYLAVGSAAGDVNRGSTIISGGKIETGTVVAGSVQAGWLTAQTISASQITTGTLSANRISGGSLSGDLISGGTITGVNIQTANSGNRVVMSSGSDQLKFYNSSGITGVIENYGGNGRLGLVAGNDLYLSANGGGSYAHLDGSSDFIVPGYLSTESGIYLNGHFLQNGNSSGHIKMDGTDKTAIVSTSKGYNALYSVESPEVWFMDFARIEHKWWQFWKKPKFILDNTFLEVTSGPYIFMPTMVKGWVQAWGKRKGHETKRFETKTEEEFLKNEEFLNMAKVVK